jgi:long-subunit fatty acid transport protein
MISATAEDEAYQPLVVGLGTSYDINPELIFALDATYYNWSKYSLVFFEEPRERDFKDVVKIAVGIEHRSSSRIFGDKAVIPFRFGVVYDPQPMKEPSSSYFGLSFGNGISWRGVHLDVGALLGRESGSGHALDLIRAAFSIGYSK